MLFMIAVFDAIGNVIEIAENGILLTIVSTLVYMMTGGWKYVFRKISFFFDTQLVKLIGAVYEYFNLLLQGELFKETIVNELINNVYVFIGVIMFFRIMMVIMKYLVNPDLISDGKIGAHALMQRVILGCCGILFIPGIFNLMISFQQAILQDNVVQQIIIPSDMLDEVSLKVNEGGHHIGTYVLAGFLNPSKYARNSDVKEFELGIERGDLSNLDVSESFLTVNFKYDYFFFISTLVLAYVFYLMLKYCIDIVVRFFKMLLYRILTPVAMIEYMINGSGDGVFKNWLSAILGTYFMLFVRILAIWFVVFVMALMDPSSSFQAKYAGSLLLNDDYFLRAIIIIGLLGFMMDLPKLVGQIFGLDLEQESSATGILKQVGGMLKGAAVGALAVGGAAAGGLYSNAKAGLKFGGSMSQNKWKTDANGKVMKDAFGNKMKSGMSLKDRIKDANKNSGWSKTAKSMSTGILGAAMNSNEFTRAAYGSAQNQTDAYKKEQGQINAEKREEAKEAQASTERKRDIIREQAKDVVSSSPKDATVEDIKANLITSMYGNPETMTMDVITNMKNNSYDSNIHAVTQEVQQVLSQRFDVAPSDVEQVVKQVTKDPNSIQPEEIEQVVNQLVGRQVKNDETIINQVVNQVAGARTTETDKEIDTTVHRKEVVEEIKKEAYNSGTMGAKEAVKHIDNK